MRKELEPIRDLTPLEEQDRNNKTSREISDFFKRHKLWRYPASIAWRIAFYACTIGSKEGREHLKNPEFRRFLYDREAQVGLTEDSIFSTDLYRPTEDGASLVSEYSAAGRWVAYDFRRPETFGKKVKQRKRQYHEGKLFSFPLDEVINNDKDDLTSPYLLDIFAIEHILALQTSNLNELLDKGFVEKTTYAQAYDRVGLYNQYKNYLILAQIADDEIYRVTPKGNTLVHISSDGGDKVQLPKGKPFLLPQQSFGF